MRVCYAIREVSGCGLMMWNCELTLTLFLRFQGFGQVRDISRAPNGCLYVDFKKASVAETVCRVSLIFGFRFCVLCFEVRVSGSSPFFFGSSVALGCIVVVVGL